MSVRILPARQSSLTFASRRVCVSPQQFIRRSRARAFSTTSSSSSDPSPTHIAASRTLPYPTYPIFKTIADISSYPSFLPYITDSKVLAQSPRPDSHHNETWPALASLTVGFQDKISETFTSRVFCVPPVPHKGRAGVGFVEALSGSQAPAPTFTPDEDVAHYDVADAQRLSQDEAGKGPLALLRTRWTVSSYPHKPAPASTDETHAANLEPGQKAKEMTNVNLVVEYRFENPVYEMLGQAASGKVADLMIDAFEKRVRDVLGKSV